MNIFQIVGIALISYAALMILGKDGQRFGPLVAAGGVICMLVPAFLSLFGMMDEVKAYVARYHFEGADVLFRGMGIAFCCEFTSDVLKDAGSAQLANALDFACRVAILALCFPLLKSIFELAGGLLS